MLKISAISAFSDNYIWAIIAEDQCFVVDPGDAKPVFTFLEEHQLTLAGILITHWHGDHTGGIDELVKHFQVDVFGPASNNIPQITHTLADGNSLEVLGRSFDVFTVPGHTLDHIAYYNKEESLLFCGDTLFAAGCGRIFEGTPDMLHQSLKKLAALPKETAVYCTHEYTLANLAFACAVEPSNAQLALRLDECTALRKENKNTLPSSIALELSTNPFLRVTEPEVIEQALNQGASSDKPVDVFACLREWKNNF
jgi:hydroxyacylglutathione hydrolase